ncbi:MAG: hybrid sensor histidine kinase/response regulator [Lachnospiraceae bacterium]
MKRSGTGTGFTGTRGDYMKEKSSKLQILQTGIIIIFSVFVVLTLTYFILGEALLPSENQQSDTVCEEFDATWYQVLSDGSRKLISIPGNLESDNGRDVVIETTLPERIEPDRYLVYRSSKQDMEVYVDGVLRTEYNTTNSRIWGKTSPVRYIFIELMQEDAGKTLRIDTRSSETYAGRIHTIYYGTETGFWMYVFREQGLPIMIGFFILIIGLFSFVAGITLSIIYKKTNKISNISASVVIVSIWIICNSNIRQVLFDNISVVSDINFLMVAMLPGPFALYMDQVQEKRYHKWYLFEEILILLDIAFTTIMQVTGVRDYADNFFIMAIVLGLLIVLIFGTMIVDAVTKNIRKYKVTALLFLFISIVVIIQVGVYLNHDTTFDITSAAIGVVLALIIAFGDTVRDILQVEKEKVEAIEKNNMKSQFLANMSHEIRTPINAIIGMNEMILRESRDEEILSYASDVETSSRALLSLVNDILDFSKIESGKMEMVNINYQPSKMIDHLVMITHGRIGDKPIMLKVNVNPELPNLLQGDEKHIAQILLNFLSNAAKYTDEGKIIITVDFKKVDDQNIDLMVSVKDTGRGIQEEDMKYLFEPFRRVDQKYNRTIEGTGLGLSIAKSLSDFLGGEIQVSSEYGIGSEFTFRVRQKVMEEETVGNYVYSGVRLDVKSHEPDKISEEIDSSKLFVLVVDDVVMNLKVFEALLKKTGIPVDRANSGFEALQMCEKKKYSIIFLDHMMPEMDGIECAHKIWSREDGLNRHTPIIMLTANAVEGVREQYLEEGFTDYLSKPFQGKDVVALIEKYAVSNIKADNE